MRTHYQLVGVGVDQQVSKRVKLVGFVVAHSSNQDRRQRCEKALECGFHPPTVWSTVKTLGMENAKTPI